MKIRCGCGGLIMDQTDGLPGKAHFIPDQDWFGVLDAMDRIVADAAAGRMTADAAQMAVRRIHCMASWTMYQCGGCGRLLVTNPQGGLNLYEPASVSDSRPVLGGRGATG